MHRFYTKFKVNLTLGTETPAVPTSPSLPATSKIVRAVGRQRFSSRRCGTVGDVGAGSDVGADGDVGTAGDVGVARVPML